MEAFSSLQSLSSVALWPVLMMNWRSIIAYFPAVERFISGFNMDVMIRMVFGTWLGLSVLGFLATVAMAHVAYSAWGIIRDLALLTCYTKCSISEDSSLYDQIMDWITRNPRFQLVNTGEVIEQSDEDIEIPDTDDKIDVARMVNEIAPQFKPETRKVRFWSGGSFFWMVERKDKKLQYHGKEGPDNYLDIYCFNWSRSTGPLKGLILEILKNNAGLYCDKTIIYAPEPSRSQYDTKPRWSRARSRLRRPLSTVILDKQQKDIIVDDIKNFLTRSGVLWYQEKGLPLRLGYLFSGPPGTGKSSLAFALASNFGLPVYMLNLSSPTFNDDDIEALFTDLPRHCILLLEDVDATQPLSRDLRNSEEAREDDLQNSMTPGSSDSDDEADMPSPGSKQLRRARGSGAKTGGNSVTLSGLLNAIDGVAASEGRILIMTTNQQESLDEALIRTGRADRIIQFSHATKPQAESMFINAYTGTRWGQHMTPEARSRHPEMEDWTDEDIYELARGFSQKIHDKVFSPALIQQYFKDFRAEPRRALQELDAWMEDPRGYRKPSLDHDLDVSLSQLKAKSGSGESTNGHATAPNAQKED